ncbi:ankyrin repeat domain-containing protein 26 isoform X13 [Falco rusticolus]|uniref:ankyrin repeat domain-containing protein 26 isoform X13 n=1 Tax=Falco rusticolus TaxID=120794 RepID=UPI0018866866|nr:ankyrin repeat domain-containing protein 26 isoform X13 [Falco rusticolus]
MNTCRVDKWLLTVLLNCISKYVVVFTKYVSSLSLYSLCKQLVAYAFRGDRDEGGAQGDTVPGIPHRAGAAGLTLGAPAVDRGGMPQSPSQTSRTGKPKKAIDGLSQGDSIGSLEKEGSDVSWHTSEEELDFTPKKLQKPNLTLLMNVSQQFRKNTGKSPRLESQRPNSVCLEQVDDEDTEEEQCEVDNKVCEALKQEREHLCLNRHDENVRAAFHSGTKEKSPEQEEEEKEQEKEDTGEELQTAVVEGVKNSICNDSHQVHSASKDNTGERSALTAVGAEEEEDAESPWDSETDSESPEEGSPGVLLPAADRHGARSRIVSGERQTGFLEKPNNSQLKAPESVLERSETSPNKKQQKSDLLEEFGLGDAEDVEGENSGSTFHMSSSAEKDNVKDAIEYYGVQVEKEKSKRRISKVQAVAKQECLGKLNIPSDNITNRQMKQKITVRKNDCLKMENENTLEEKDKKSFSSEESSKLIKMPMKCKMALNAKVAKKSRRQPSKQKAHQQMSSSSGNHGQVRDDGTSSETSEDEGRCSLKQEEAKRLRVEVLCEKVREKLQRKEDQYCKEREGKQKLELHSRNLEMEIRTLRKLLKRVEEERDETQTQRSQEKSARALQEGILNNHLGRQMELEEETRRSIGKNSEESNTEREKDLLYKNQLLQDEIAVLRLEINQVRLKHQEEEGKSLEENETLKEKNEALKKELKLNKEALTQTVLQYNAQLDFLKTESAVLTSKLEQTNESKDRLEAEIKSFHSRLNAAVQELERHRSSEKDAEQRFHRERDEWHRLQGKLHHDLSDTQETNKSLSQQLCKAESKANRLENELHQLEQTLREKTLLVEMTQKELSQAQRQAKECDRAQQLEKDPVSELVIKQESLQERLAQLQSENLFLRQQLEDAQSKRIMKAEVVNDVQDRFNDTLNKLRADTEKQVYLIEERNKDLNAKCTDLREQVFKYETDKVEREGMVRQLQQELADALKKQSMSEASLEVTTRYRSDLEEDKLRLQKELEKVKTELRELEEQHLQSEHCVHDLKAALDNKEREVTASSQKLQELLKASSGTNTTIKQLQEDVQRLEIENARLEATVQQQSDRIEALQRDLQAFASVHNHLEDLITSLRTTQAAAEGHHHQETQKQNMLALTSKDLHSMWEEHLKSRFHLEERVAQLDKEKAELLQQCESERKEVKKLVELKRPAELRLDQEMKRNLDLQKDCKSLLCRLKRLLSRATKELRVYEERGGLSQLNLQGEMKNRYSEMVNEIGRLRTKVDELSQQLEIESKKGMQLEAQNHDLREELSTMRGNHEELEKSKSQLKEEVANLKHHMETNMVDRSQIEQYKREVEERAAQEIRQKLQEVNLILQGSGRREYGWARCFHVRAVCLQALNQKLAKMQAASQDRLEQIRASHHALLTSQLEQRIGDLERELDRIKNTQRDSTFQKESAQAEVEKYKDLYLEEVKNGRCLANKLERANERLAEANAELLQECHRSKPLIASSAVSGPVLYSAELGHISNNPALNRSLNLGGSFLTPTGNTLPSRNRVEAYVAKVRQELDERIAKELKQATAELEAGSAGASPVVFSDGSSKSIHVDQDPLCRAVQEYRDVLTKNYLI